MASVSLQVSAMPRKKAQSKPKKKRGRQGWTSNEQEMFLTSYILQHKVAQANKTYDKFWATVHTAFSARWPLEPPLEEDIQAKVTMDDKHIGELKVSLNTFLQDVVMLTVSQKIKIWYNNNGKGSSVDKKPDLLDLIIKTKKQLQDWQAYLKIYYKSKIRDTVEEQWEALQEKKEAGEIEDMPNALKFCNTVTQEMLVAEINDVKEEVEQYWKAVIYDNDSNDEVDVDGDLATQVAKAKEYME